MESYKSLVIKIGGNIPLAMKMGSNMPLVMKMGDYIPLMIKCMGFKNVRLHVLCLPSSYLVVYNSALHVCTYT